RPHVIPRAGAPGTDTANARDPHAFHRSTRHSTQPFRPGVGAWPVHNYAGYVRFRRQRRGQCRLQSHAPAPGNLAPECGPTGDYIDMSDATTRTTRKRTRATPATARIAPAASTGPSLELLDDYIAELSRIPVLSADAQKDLARVMRDENRSEDEREAARGELVRANLRFAFSVAKKFQHRGVNLEDLVSEANSGLLRATDKYDPDVGVNFISYAVWWIRQALLASLAEGRGRAPSGDARAAAGEVPGAVVRALRPAPAPAHSLDAPMRGSRGRDGSRTLGDVIASPDDDSEDVIADLEQESQRDAIGRAMEILPPRERAILRMYYGLDGEESLTLTSIAERFGITRERVRQLRDRALERLRNAEEAKTLEDEWAA